MLTWILFFVLFQAAKPPAPFKSPYTVEQMTGKLAVVNTTAGTFVIDLRRADAGRGGGAGQQDRDHKRTFDSISRSREPS